MIFGGLEILALKWVGGHITTALAGHLAAAGPTAVAHFAHAAATNILVSAGSASTATGVVSTLYAGGKAGAKLTKKVMKIQSKAKLRAMFKDKSLTDEERSELLIAAVIFQLAESYFASLERPISFFGDRVSEDGSHLKTKLLQMERCEEDDCECMDFISDPNKGRDWCQCGHLSGTHEMFEDDMDEIDDPKAIDWLLEGIAAEVYPSLQSRNADGCFKTELREVDTCMESGCPCWDFDWAVGRGFISKRCYCGHRYTEHVVTGKYHWIIGEIVSEIIRENGLGFAVEGESSSESDSDSDNDDSDEDESEDEDVDVDDQTVYDSDFSY